MARKTCVGVGEYLPEIEKKKVVRIRNANQGWNAHDRPLLFNG